MNARKRLAPDASRDEIVNAAALLALEVGLAGITRDAVALKADRSQGIVSHYFDMEGLRVAVVQAAIEHGNAGLLADALTVRDEAIKAAVREAPEALLRKARAILLKS